MTRFLEQALALGTATPDERDGRVYGWIPGVVTDIDTKLMQVKARLGKMEDGESTHWLVPMGMGSIESVPEVGDPVAVIFMDGDPNAGGYSYFPQSTTKGRPTQHMILGDLFVGMFNFFADQFNQLRADFNTFVTTTYNSHTHPYVNVSAPATTSATTSVGTSTSALTANKGQDSAGSTVANQSSAQKVLSKRSLVR